MEAEEDLPAASKSVLADNVSSARRTTGRQQRHEVEHHQHSLPGGCLAPMPSTGSVAVDLPTGGTRAPLVGAGAVWRATATAASFGGATTVTMPADILSAMPAGAAALLPAGTLGAARARVAAAGSSCNAATPTAAYSGGDNTVRLTARQRCVAELSESFHPCTSGEEWWLPQSEPNEWSEWEERAGVVSRVLQVLRCEGLLREARKALQSACAEMMDGKPDACTADAEHDASEPQGRPAAAAPPAAGDNGIPLRGSAVRGTAKAVRTAVVGTAAARVDQPARWPAAEEAETGGSRGSVEAGAILADKDREARAFESSVASREDTTFSGVALSSLDVKPSLWHHLHIREPVSTLDTSSCSSRTRVVRRNEEEARCLENEGGRRSVWMRGERSEDDLQDDSKIKALRALIPKLLATVPEWLDTKLDTGRRGEWLGFEKVLPSILRQRFGFTGDELRKDGPFCWKGSRRTSITEVSLMLLSSTASTEDSHAATHCTQYSEEARTAFLHRQQGRQQERDQQQLFPATEGQQFQQQGLQPDASPQQELHQPHAQQLASADLVLSAERVTVGSNEGCDRRQQLEEHPHTFEAMDVDEEGGELSLESSSCRGVSDNGRDFQRGNRSSSSAGEAAEPMERSPRGRQESGILRGEPGDTANSHEDTTVVLEVTSVWVNGFQESGKPYDVHVQARVDGHMARDFYIEIKATVATHPCFVLSLRQLDFARSQGPDNYLILVICSIRAASPAWMILDNVAERVARCLHFPPPTMVDSSNQQAATTTTGPALPSDVKIRCRFKEQVDVSHVAARGQLTEQGIDDILGCLLKPSRR